MKIFFLTIFAFIFIGAKAQVNDSASVRQQSTREINDTAKRTSNRANTVNQRTSLKSDSAKDATDNAEEQITHSYVRRPISKKEALSFYLPESFYKKGANYDSSLISFHKDPKMDDAIFYSLLGLLLLLGIIRTVFPKYFKQIFQFILQPGLRKRNMKDGISTENVLPSLLFNLIFIISVSLYIILPANADITADNSKKYWILCALALACIYSIKYIIIKISGWIFNAQPAATIYNYVVFSINKLVGIVLIPVIILLVYANSSIAANIYSAVGFIIVALLLYRYIASFILIRDNLKVNVLHFFIYLCAIEILPLLVIYKILLIKFGKII